METGIIQTTRGEAITVAFQFTPITDITGWTFVLTLAQYPNSSEKILTKNCTTSIAVDGKFFVDFTSNEMNLSPGLYTLDVFRTNVGQERCVFLGNLSIIGNARYPVQP